MTPNEGVFLVMKLSPVKRLTFSAILVALGILIPMVMPKVVIGPASFTLASHVPVFLAMFISPGVAVAVTLGTAFGFFLSLPVIIAFRALSHIVFALLGAMYLQKHPEIINSMMKFQIFNVVIGIIHATVELLVVAVFFIQGSMTASNYEAGFLYTVVILIGFGGFIHSLVDYNIAFFIGQRLSKHFTFPVFVNGGTKKIRTSQL